MVDGEPHGEITPLPKFLEQVIGLASSLTFLFWSVAYQVH
jgi:hypothetical protein